MSIVECFSMPNRTKPTITVNLNLVHQLLCRLYQLVINRSTTTMWTIDDGILKWIVSISWRGSWGTSTLDRNVGWTHYYHTNTCHRFGRKTSFVCVGAHRWTWRCVLLHHLHTTLVVLTYCWMARLGNANGMDRTRKHWRRPWFQAIGEDAQQYIGLIITNFLERCRRGRGARKTRKV